MIEPVSQHSQWTGRLKESSMSVPHYAIQSTWKSQTSKSAGISAKLEVYSHTVECPVKENVRSLPSYEQVEISLHVCQATLKASWMPQGCWEVKGIWEGQNYFRACIALPNAWESWQKSFSHSSAKIFIYMLFLMQVTYHKWWGLDQQ